MLGGTIVMQNVTGGVGAIGLNQVADAETDGYSILFAAENPLIYKVMKLRSTGPGGLPSVVTAMINSKTPLDVTFVPDDGDGPALTALQGGAIDVMPAVLGAAMEGVKGGTMKAIALIDGRGFKMLSLSGGDGNLRWAHLVGDSEQSARNG